MVRQRQAHFDAKLSTTIKAIALTFGLPVKSIRLCHRDGRKMRGNATVNTLRKVWAPKVKVENTEPLFSAAWKQKQLKAIAG